MVFNAAALPVSPSYRAEVMMTQMVLDLCALGSYVDVMSDEVNLTATIPPGYALQDYLCSGPLKSNTTVVLDDGEHRISSGPPCDIFNGSSITIKGSSVKNTTVRCEGKGRLLQFSSVQKLTLERMTFIGWDWYRSKILLSLTAHFCAI